MFWEVAKLLSSPQAPNLADPLDWTILSLGTNETVNSPRYAPQNISSPRVETGKW